MYTTLDHLETLAYKRRNIGGGSSIFKELLVFGVIAVSVSFGMLIFTNARLFYTSFQENVLGESTLPDVQVNKRNSSDSTQDTTIADSISMSDQQLAHVKQLIDNYTQQGVIDTPYADTMESNLEKTQDQYTMRFNTLPPTNRLIIPGLKIDIPIVDSAHKYMNDFTQGNFDDELKLGVVKYPTTPEPGSVGNTLIFGHTSQERRQHNPYGMIFSHIPKLNQGDLIQVIWKGQLYEYQVVEKSVQKIKNVNNEYLKYQNMGDSYLTLMGCYPIGTTKERIMIMAKRIYSSM